MLDQKQTDRSDINIRRSFLLCKRKPNRDLKLVAWRDSILTDATMQLLRNKCVTVSAFWVISGTPHLLFLPISLFRLHLHPDGIGNMFLRNSRLRSNYNLLSITINTFSWCLTFSFLKNPLQVSNPFFRSSSGGRMSETLISK
jgi:hypothetical protein